MRLFRPAALVCLVAAIGCIALYEISYRWEMVLVCPVSRWAPTRNPSTPGEPPPSPFMAGIFLSRGSVYFAWGVNPPLNAGRFGLIVRAPQGFYVGRYGFAWNRQPYGWSVAAPIWPGALLLAAVAAVMFHRDRRRRRRESTGLCAVCGYDLRATPARCPECGAVPEGMTKRE